MSDFSCKGCGSRKAGCHATCEKYIAEKKAWDEKQAEMRKQKNIRDGLDWQVINNINRTKKRMGKQKPSQMGGQ